MPIKIDNAEKLFMVLALIQKVNGSVVINKKKDNPEYTLSAEDVEAALIENKLFDNWVKTKETTDKMLDDIFTNALVKKFVTKTDINGLLIEESIFTDTKDFSESRWYYLAFKGMVKLKTVVNLAEALFNDMNFHYINEYMNNSKKNNDEASVYIQYFLNQYKVELNIEVNGYEADVDSRPSSPNDSSLDECSDGDSMVSYEESKETEDGLASDETEVYTEEFPKSQEKKSSNDSMVTDNDSKVLVNESKEPEDNLDLNKIEEGKDEYTESHEKKSFKDYYWALIFDRYIDGWDEQLFIHDKIMKFFAAITQKPELFSIELLDQLNQEMLDTLTEDQVNTILQKIGYLQDESLALVNLPQKIKKALNVPQSIVSLNRFLGILQQGQDSNSSLDDVSDDESKLSDDLASIETEGFTSKDLFNSMEHSQQQDFIESILSHHYVFWAVFKTFIPWASLEEYYNKNDDNEKNIEIVFDALQEKHIKKILGDVDPNPFQKKCLYRLIKNEVIINTILRKDINDAQYISLKVLTKWAKDHRATIATKLDQLNDESSQVLYQFIEDPAYIVQASLNYPQRLMYFKAEQISSLTFIRLDSLRRNEKINTNKLCDLLNPAKLMKYAHYLKDKELSDNDKIDVLWSVCRYPQSSDLDLKSLFDGFGYNFSENAIEKVKEARRKCDENPKSFSVFSESEMEATDIIKIVKKIALGAKSSDKHQRLQELDQKTTGSNHWKRWGRWARNKNKFSYSYVLKEFQKQQKKQLKKDTHKPSKKNEI